MSKRQHYKTIAEIRRRLIREYKEEFGFVRCFFCGEPISENAARTSNEGIQVDHFIALSEGGNNSTDNYVLMHGGCNNFKGNMDFSVAKKKAAIRKKPSRDWGI